MKEGSYETMYAVIGTGEVYAFGIVPWKGLGCASDMPLLRVVSTGPRQNLAEEQSDFSLLQSSAQGMRHQ